MSLGKHFQYADAERSSEVAHFASTEWSFIRHHTQNPPWLSAETMFAFFWVLLLSWFATGSFKYGAHPFT